MVSSTRVDEARRALRLGLHAHVEPNGRVEGHLLFDEQVRQLVVEGVARSGRVEVAAAFTPGGDGVGHAADQVPHGGFALGRVDLPVEIFRGDDVRGRLRPGLGDLDILLAEDDLSLFVADLSGAPLPFDGVKGRDSPIGEIALELEAGLGLHFRRRCRTGCRLLVQGHLRLCHVASAQVGVPFRGEPYYFTSIRTSRRTAAPACRAGANDSGKPTRAARVKKCESYRLAFRGDLQPANGSANRKDRRVGAGCGEMPASKMSRGTRTGLRLRCGACGVGGKAAKTEPLSPPNLRPHDNGAGKRCQEKTARCLAIFV